MTENVEKSEKELLVEIARWMRELALPLVRGRAAPLLDTESKRRVYQAMESGTATIKTIEAVSGANHRDIRAWATEWEREGIAEAGANPPKASFTLRDLGIDTPPPKATRTATAKT